MTIESLKNDKIKFLKRLLADNRYRKKCELFIVEGKHEIQRALQFGYEAVEFFVCEKLFQKSFLLNAKTNYVSEKLYEKIAYRGSTEGIIGVYKTNSNALHSYKPKENASIVILESVEKPGNLGAIMRSCEAFGIDALIITDTKIDFYNPNVIRSSVGCIFGINFYSGNNIEVYQFLKKNDFKIYTTFMNVDSEYIGMKKFSNKSAFLFGTEHSGLSSFWQNKGENILIPTVGTIDSLNLSNAVAILCYESAKQKNPTI